MGAYSAAAVSGYARHPDAFANSSITCLRGHTCDSLAWPSASLHTAPQSAAHVHDACSCAAATALQTRIPTRLPRYTPVERCPCRDMRRDMYTHSTPGIPSPSFLVPLLVRTPTCCPFHWAFCMHASSLVPAPPPRPHPIVSHALSVGRRLYPHHFPCPHLLYRKMLFSTACNLLWSEGYKLTAVYRWLVGEYCPATPRDSRFEPP
jgi:hypothetical protein